MALIFLLGRIIFGGYWLENAYNHFKNREQLAAYAASKKVPHPLLAVEGSGALLLIGGLSIITGRWPGIGLIALAAFLIPVTFTMHQYWKETDPMVRSTQRVNFFKNLALLGAVLMITAIKIPWPYSL